MFQHYSVLRRAFESHANIAHNTADANFLAFGVQSSEMYTSATGFLIGCKPMTRQALLYLPGIDGTGRLLYRQARLFEEYEVHCVQYPQLQPSTYQDLTSLAVQALEASPGRRPAVVLTESFGGAVALSLTRSRPDLVDRLVFINSFASYPHRGLIRLLARIGSFLPAKPGHPATRSLCAPFFFAPDIPMAERDTWWQLTDDVPLSAFGMRFRMIAGLDLRPVLPAIAKPALVLAAANDCVVAPSAGRLLARRLPYARLLQMPVGHTALIHPRVDISRWLRS
jgi:pimeloyl-ACP methyl ester carboxylesterase